MTLKCETPKCTLFFGFLYRNGTFSQFKYYNYFKCYTLGSSTVLKICGIDQDLKIAILVKTHIFPSQIVNISETKFFVHIDSIFRGELPWQP